MVYILLKSYNFIYLLFVIKLNSCYLKQLDLWLAFLQRMCWVIEQGMCSFFFLLRAFLNELTVVPVKHKTDILAVESNMKVLKRTGYNWVRGGTFILLFFLTQRYST